jgi:hypothetical protein
MSKQKQRPLDDDDGFDRFGWEPGDVVVTPPTQMTSALWERLTPSQRQIVNEARAKAGVGPFAG